MFEIVLSEVLAGLEPIKEFGVSHVGPWSGETATPDSIDRHAAGSTPAVLAAISSAVPADESQYESFSGKRHQTILRVSIVCLCIVVDSRSIDDLMYKNDANGHSVLSLSGLVAKYLNGLRLTVSYKRKPVRFLGIQPFLIKPDSFAVYSVTFEAYVVLGQRPLTDAESGEPTEYTGADVLVNRIGDVDGDPEQVPQPDVSNPLQNPRNEITANPEES